MDNSLDDEDKEQVALMGYLGTVQQGNPDDEFFLKVQTIHQTMVKLENKVWELEKQEVTILAMFLPEESMKQDLQNLPDEIKQLGRENHTQLKAIEPQKEEADNFNSVNTRMRKTQHGVLSQQFLELITSITHNMQSEYQEKNMECIQRQLKITNAGMVSDEELEQMLDSGQSEVLPRLSANVDVLDVANQEPRLSASVDVLDVADQEPRLSARCRTEVLDVAN
ncbi:Syntaxin-4 [Sciurus carolinensis]|uniref:Syntaxin-4 n=1 Tax=Sciurus carolinensis TaxID=30640 RepID=A0AA41MLF7_SCICA|nr:Syntaxin-4 [Sciurus carolinensis]